MINSIIVNNISFKYNIDFIIKDFNYHFLNNNIYCIYGKNASGKSTLLKLIAGILSPQNGNIEYHTKLNIKKDNILKNISFFAPYVNYLSVFSVKENYKLISKLRNRKINENKLKELLNHFDINNFYSQNISQLSTGTIVKFKIIQNFIFESDILIFDEAFENLDNESSSIFKYLLNKESENKIILISSAQQNSLDFCHNFISL